MQSETSLKILIALNAVQIFITLLLVATMASTGINAKSAASGYGGLSTRASGVEADPYDPALQAYAMDGTSLSESAAPSQAVDGVMPPGNEGAISPDAAASIPSNSADLAAGATEKTAKSERNQVILRTYINLVSRRLELASKDADVDPVQYLPTLEEIDAAIASGDASSDAFKQAVSKLQGGYDALEMDFPAPPGSKSSGAGK